MTILPENLKNERTLLPMFSSFMKEFKVNQLFRKCHMNKKKGFPVKDVFQMIFLLVFTGKSFSGFLHSKNPIFQGKKDTIYRFLQKTSGCWRKLLFLLSSQVVTKALFPLTSLKRYTWVVDDSPYERPRSSKVKRTVAMLWSLPRTVQSRISPAYLGTYRWCNLHPLCFFTVQVLIVRKISSVPWTLPWINEVKEQSSEKNPRKSLLTCSSSSSMKPWNTIP